jgi:fructosamine-3-kinase
MNSQRWTVSDEQSAMDYERIELPGGKPGFRKSRRDGGSDCFEAEARGLAAIAATATIATPAVLRCNDRELVTEFITAGQPSKDGWETLGRQLARMHAVAQSRFGFEGDNYCGATPQINTPCRDGFEFFAEYRLNYQARLARDNDLLDETDVNQVASIARQLPELVPVQPPALLHGDLWRGNVLFGSGGTVYLIDPSCYVARGRAGYDDAVLRF